MIRALQLREIATAIGAASPARDLPITGIGTDSRTIGAGELFVALCGERFDGHQFAAQAVTRGAAALVCSREVEVAAPVLAVADTEIALGSIARLHRSLFTGTLVALTGSAGKTTTKDMIAAVLRAAGAVHATRGNLNNEIGVPLTLFALDADARYAVIEMGAGKPGDIAYLAGIARPDVALVTNALPAHLERLGTLEEVARTKGALYEALPGNGVAVLNIDDDFAPQWSHSIGARRIVRVSARGAADADVAATAVRVEQGMAHCTLRVGRQQTQLTLPLPGVQQVANAVAAAGVAHALGIGLTDIRAGLESMRPAPGRMQPMRGRGGCLVIDDTYNANPGSMRAAIDTLASFAPERVLVLGNMAELGADAAALHAGVGSYARERGIERVLATGVHARALVEAFGGAGRAFETRDELARACAGFDREGVTMLVKGSRSAGMEAVVAALAPGAARAGLH